MDISLVHILLSNSALQGAAVNTVLKFLTGFLKEFDANHKVDAVRPYMEKALVALTIVVTIIKAALDGHLADTTPILTQVINAVVFYLGAKGVPATKIENGAKSLHQGIRGLRGPE